VDQDLRGGPRRATQSHRRHDNDATTDRAETGETDAAAADDRSAVLDPLGDVLLVVGVGGLAVGAAYLAVGTSDANNAPNAATVAGWHHDADAATRDRELGAIAGGVGVVCTALAIWRFIGVSHANTAAEHASIGIAPASGGAFAWFRSSF
jgi:hypothetical protein